MLCLFIVESIQISTQTKLITMHMTLEPLYLVWIYTIALPNYSGFKCLIIVNLSGLSVCF